MSCRELIDSRTVRNAGKYCRLGYCQIVPVCLVVSPGGLLQAPETVAVLVHVRVDRKQVFLAVDVFQFGHNEHFRDLFIDPAADGLIVEILGDLL